MRYFPLVALLFLLLLHPDSWSQQLSCKPCGYAFGKVKVGTSVRFSFRLSNTGNKSLRILSKSKQGGEFQFGSFPLPITIRPGNAVELPIIFRPTIAGRVTGGVTLASTALDPKLSLSLAGTGVSGPQLTVSPTSLNFGNVTVGNSATLSTVLAATNGNVTLSSAQLTSSEFTISGLNPPVTIPSGTSVQVKIRFTPSQSGTGTGKAGYFSDAVVSPAVELFTGTGVAANAHSVSLTWQESSSGGVIGYNVYRGTAHGGPYHAINTVLDASTNYSDYNVSAGSTYYYVTTAVDSAGRQSAYSNETRAIIPNP